MSTPRPLIRTLEPVLERLCSTARAVSDGAAAVAWLLGPGDVCDSCPAAPRCADRRTCLHRVASSAEAGLAADAQARVPLGDGALGRAPSGHEPVALEDPADLGLAEPAWLATQGVRAGAVVPLEHGGRCIGVLAVLSRAGLSADRVAALGCAAGLGAEAIANVSAFRDLATDRNRLAALNARLRSGLGLPPEPEPAPAPPPLPVATPGRAATRPTAPAAAVPAPPAVEAPAVTVAPDVLAALGVMVHAEVSAALPVRPFSEVQREGILRALERTGWKVSGPTGAASLLGLKPTTLESKMKKLGIRRPLRQG